MKLTLKKEAICLRKSGYSYSEILEKVPVARSTLSLWLREVHLSTRQKQRLTQKRLTASLRGGRVKKQKRIQLTKEIERQAIFDIKKISQRELWLMGIMLYWGEGAKSKEHNPSQGIVFSNSDPYMIRLFLKWLISSLGITNDRIAFELYIHESAKNRLSEVTAEWASLTGFSPDKFSRIYFKKHTVTTNRKNVGDSYRGVLRVKVTKSTNLNRKITGWVKGIYNQCGVV